jgi:hypothetical protein
MCGVFDGPAGDVKLADSGLTEGYRDGRGRTARAEEQDAPAPEFDICLFAGHDHPAPVRVVAAHPRGFDHDGVYGTGDAGAFVQIVD